jgi:hypothetical protein
MSYNMMIGYDIYDRFTMEHFPLRQSMILTTSFFCSRQYIVINNMVSKVVLNLFLFKINIYKNSMYIYINQKLQIYSF